MRKECAESNSFLETRERVSQESYISAQVKSVRLYGQRNQSRTKIKSKTTFYFEKMQIIFHCTHCRFKKSQS
jgi:hypothetical protein